MSLEVKFQFARFSFQEFIEIGFHYQKVLATRDEFINAIINGKEKLTCNLMRDGAEVLKVQPIFERILKE